MGPGCRFTADVAAWPYSVGILCKFSAFLGTLHWPAGTADVGHFGVSFLEVLALFEQWAGHWLISEKVTWPHERANRPMSISSVPVSEGIEIRHDCQFIRSLVRTLAKLSGGMGRFLPCVVASRMSRSRHLGWSQCSHGLTSRPLQGLVTTSASRLYVGFWEYPTGSALLHFHHALSPWSLPTVGNGGGKR